VVVIVVGSSKAIPLVIPDCPTRADPAYRVKPVVFLYILIELKISLIIHLDDTDILSALKGRRFYFFFAHFHPQVSRHIFRVGFAEPPFPV
jgi:hypothetical protein